MLISDKAQRKESVVSQFLQLTLSIRQSIDITHVDRPGHADYVKHDHRCSSDGWCYPVVAAMTKLWLRLKAYPFFHQVGVPWHPVVFMNKCDMVDDEGFELVEMEIRDLLSEYDFGDDIPVIRVLLLKL